MISETFVALTDYIALFLTSLNMLSESFPQEMQKFSFYPHTSKYKKQGSVIINNLMFTSILKKKHRAKANDLII